MDHSESCKSGRINLVVVGQRGESRNKVLERDFDVSSTETGRNIWQTHMGYIVTVVPEAVR
jgi:hypothetical protein